MSSLFDLQELLMRVGRVHLKVHAFEYISSTLRVRATYTTRAKAWEFSVYTMWIEIAPNPNMRKTRKVMTSSKYKVKNDPDMAIQQAPKLDEHKQREAATGIAVDTDNPKIHKG